MKKKERRRFHIFQAGSLKAMLLRVAGNFANGNSHPKLGTGKIAAGLFVKKAERTRDGKK